ncbi:MAG: acyltransferase [Bacteroidales bacterium]
MKQNRTINSPGHIVWIDVLRFIAIFMVICIHCCDPFNVSPEARLNPEFNFWGTVYGSFLRPCVPLFVMITGLLLLPVRMDFGLFYRKRLLRIAVPFLIWSVLYNLYPWITGVLEMPSSSISEVFAYASSDASQSWESAWTNILLIPFRFNVYTVPMWYLYMLLGLYLYMPVFSAWVEKATRTQKKNFLYIWGATLFLPYAYTFITKDLFGIASWNSFGTFYYFAGFNGYLLLGHYMGKELSEWSWNRTLSVALPLFAVGYATTYAGFKYMTANPACSEADMELFFLYCSPNVVLMTIAVFLFVRKIRIRSAALLRIFAHITQCGLGIYMVHYFAVGIGYAIADVLAIPISVRIPVTAFFVFMISWAFVGIGFKWMPKSAKWIFG